MTFSSDQSLNTNQLPISLNINPNEPNYEEILLLYLRRIANAVNTKQSGLHLLQETANFEQYFGTTPQQNRNGYRTTFDLVALNGAPIPASATTSIVLTTATQPPFPNGYMFPIHANGGAIDSTGISYFINDLKINIRYNSSTKTIIIQNDLASTLTWCVWSMEYLKN